MSRRFLILHGWQGSGPEHWQTWLAAQLRLAGEDVAYPELPSPDLPDPSAWRAALRTELAAARVAGELVVCCHSLGCVLWLQHAAAAFAIADGAGISGPDAVIATRVLLVAPPCPAAGVPEIAGFYPHGATRAAVAAAAGSTRLVCGTGDPYCPGGADRVYAERFGIPADVIPDGGHLNTDAGYGSWPAVLDWCLDADAPLHGREQLAAAGQSSGVKNGAET